MTKVVNRFTIITGAACMILAGLLPPVGNFFASLPESVLGGCTIMMFGTILTSGMQMVAFPEMIQNVFAANVVAVVFVASIILNMVLPRNMEIEKMSE